MNLSLPYGTGLEFAIVDDEDNCLTCAGSVFRMYRPAPLIYRRRSTGQWNQVRIVAVKDSVEHWLNGVKLLGYKYHSADFWKQFDAAKWDSASARYLTYKVPGNHNGGYIERGYIGFQAVKGDHWQLRNVRINATTPKLGRDDWWSTALQKPRNFPASKPPSASKPQHGNPLLAVPGGDPVQADGRAPF